MLNRLYLLSQFMFTNTIVYIIMSHIESYYRLYLKSRGNEKRDKKKVISSTHYIDIASIHVLLILIVIWREVNYVIITSEHNQKTNATQFSELT